MSLSTMRKRKGQPIPLDAEEQEEEPTKEAKTEECVKRFTSKMTPQELEDWKVGVLYRHKYEMALFRMQQKPSLEAAAKQIHVELYFAFMRAMGYASPHDFKDVAKQVAQFLYKQVKYQQTDYLIQPALYHEFLAIGPEKRSIIGVGDVQPNGELFVLRARLRGDPRHSSNELSVILSGCHFARITSRQINEDLFLSGASCHVTAEIESFPTRRVSFEGEITETNDLGPGTLKDVHAATGYTIETTSDFARGVKGERGRVHIIDVILNTDLKYVGEMTYHFNDLTVHLNGQGVACATGERSDIVSRGSFWEGQLEGNGQRTFRKHSKYVEKACYLEGAPMGHWEEYFAPDSIDKNNTIRIVHRRDGQLESVQMIGKKDQIKEEVAKLFADLHYNAV